MSCKIVLFLDTFAINSMYHLTKVDNCANNICREKKKILINDKFFWVGILYVGVCRNKDDRFLDRLHIEINRLFCIKGQIMDEKKKSSKASEVREIIKYLSLVTQIGLTLAANVIVGLFAGRFLDRWLDTGVIFLIIFIILGIASGFRSVYKLIMGLEQKRPEESRPDQEEKPEGKDNE